MCKDENNKDKYVLDREYCSERSDLIRYYNFLQKNVLNIFDYIEPSSFNLKTFSPKNYQILSNICMEVENNFKGILNANNYTGTNSNYNMQDYKKIKSFMKLSEYEVKLNFRTDIDEIKPFINFTNGTRLEWYQEYKEVKHDRTREFNKASLENVLKALAGLYVVLKAQFGIYSDISGEPYSLNFLQAGSGVYNPQNALPIFEIIKYPDWLDEEVYNFDWSEVCLKANKFRQINFE